MKFQLFVTKKIKFLLAGWMICLLFVSCDLSSPEEVDNAEIEDIFTSIESAFIFADLDKIMDYYHPEFLHGTDTYNFERIIWEIRLNDYEVLEISDIDIDLNDEFAVVSFTMQLGDITSLEPSAEFGDISYFYREYGEWKICGNNFSSL